MRWLVLAAVACQTASAPPLVHYRDANGNALTAYEPVWQQLHARFGDALPAAIGVERVGGSTSRFDANRNTILVAEGSLAYQTELGVVAHESCHLALASLSAGASTEEQLRFLDEGLATAVEQEVEGTLASYRGKAAELVRNRPRIHIAELEVWSTYFGHASDHPDWKAYDVAADLVLFLDEAFGRAKLDALLADLARTRSFDASCVAVLGLDSAELEQRWWAAR
jgi:hypothetical protein